jgi:hypothetical protein
VVGPTYVDATEAGRRIRRGARLWTVAVATFKSETYRFLRSAAPEEGGGYPAGYIHLPRQVDAEWVKQLASEQLVTVKTRRGFTRLEWQKLRVSATRRWTAGSMRGQPPGLPALTAGRSASGRSRRSSSASTHSPCRRRRQSPLNKGCAPVRCRIGAPYSPVGWEDGRGTGCNADNPIKGRS